MMAYRILVGLIFCLNTTLSFASIASTKDNNSAQKFVYTFSKFLVSKGSLTYKVAPIKNAQDDEFYRIESETEIYVFGSLKSRIKQVSVNAKNLAPVKNLYCQWPKPDNKSTRYFTKKNEMTCNSSNFTEDGRVLMKKFDTESLELTELSENDPTVSQYSMEDIFESYTPYADSIHDLASFFLAPRFLDFTMADDGKAFYLALLDYKAKLILKVTKQSSRQLKFTFKAAAGTHPKVEQYVPRAVYYDTQLKVITKLILVTNFGDVTVNLDRNRSSF